MVDTMGDRARPSGVTTLPMPAGDMTEADKIRTSSTIPMLTDEQRKAYAQVIGTFASGQYYTPDQLYKMAQLYAEGGAWGAANAALDAIDYLTTGKRSMRAAQFIPEKGTTGPSTGVGAGTTSPAPASPAGKSPASTPAPAPGVQVNGYSFESAKQKLAAANSGNAAVMDALGKAQTFADLAVIAPNGYKAYINPDGTAPDQVTLSWAKKQAAAAPAVAVSATSPATPSAAGPSTTPQSAEFQAASAEDQLAARYLGGDTTLTDRDRKQAEYYISQIHNRGQKSLRTTFSSTGAKQWDSTVLQTAANYLNIGQPENGGIKDNPALSALFIDKPGIEKKKAEAQIALDFAQAEEAVKNAGYLDAKTQGYGVELGIEAAKLTMQQAMANSVDFAKAVDLFKMEAEPWLAGLTEVRKALAKDPFNKDLKNREQEYLRMMQESPNWQNIQKAITFIESRTMNVPTTLGLDFIKKYGFFSTKVNGEYTFPLLDFTGLGMGTSTGADNVTGSGGAAGEAAAAGLPDVYE